MYYYISGEVTKIDQSFVVIDAGGVGYLIYVSANTMRKVSGVNKAKLYTYLAVKEDSQDLYGFYDENELYAFKKLIDVSGVGPKAAISVLSALTPDKLTLAIATGDIKAITSAQGIGRKIAERIVLELKDKFASGLVSDTGGGDYTLNEGDSNKVSEAINALIVLGYSRAEASGALRGIDTVSLSIEEIIRKALANLM